METVELNRRLNCETGYDVIVAGGGPAGCAAAVAAAREGAKTLLLESTGVLGGMGTSGLVPAWAPFGDNKNYVNSGFAKTLFDAAKRGMRHIKPTDINWVPIDHERLKRAYDEAVTQAGVDVLFQTQLCAVEADGGHVRSIVTASKAGLKAYSAPVYIDCTGDADLCAFAGAEFQQGDESGETQPCTLCFVLSNVDDYGFRHPRGGMKIEDAAKIMELDEGIDNHWFYNIIGPGTVGFNCGHLWHVDSTDPAGVSAALIRGRKICAQYAELLAKMNPAAFGNAFLVSSAAVLGVRESRRVTGDYVLNVEDYMTRRTFPDDICCNRYFIDQHVLKEQREKEKKGEFDFDSTKRMYGEGEYHGIPYRTLTPKGLDNVLVAGRTISCDRPLQGSIRVMPVCLNVGEAAGIAAAVAAAQGLNIHAVDVQTLRSRLRDWGAFLPEHIG